MPIRRLLLAAVLGLSLGCLSEGKVEDRIEAANYCDVADDCIAISPGCPLGCIRLINRAEEQEIQALVDRYHRTHRDNCAYDCVGIGEIRCEGGECVADPDDGGV